MEELRIVVALRIVLAQHDNPPRVLHQCFQGPIQEQQLQALDRIAPSMQNIYWNTAEIIIRTFELGTTIDELIKKLRHTIFKLLQNSPVNYTEHFKIKHVNPVDHINDTSVQSGSNTPRNNCQIAGKTLVPQAGPSRVRLENRVATIGDITLQGGGNSPINIPAPQAGPSRIRQKNPVDPVLKISRQDEGSSPRNNASIKVLKRFTLQARPSWMRQENSVVSIQDSSSQDEDNSISSNGSIEDCENYAQQAGSPHNRDEKDAAQVNMLRNHQSFSDPDMVRISLLGTDVFMFLNTE